MKGIGVIALVFFLSGCVGFVMYNDGEKVSLQSEAWVGLDSLQKTANKACQSYGKSKAVYQHSSNVGDALPEGHGAQNTLWKCVD